MAIEFGPPGYYPERPQTDFWVPPTTVEESYTLLQSALTERNLSPANMFHTLASAAEIIDLETLQRRYGMHYSRTKYAPISFDLSERLPSLPKKSGSQITFRLNRVPKSDYQPRIECTSATIVTKGNTTVCTRSLAFFRNPDGDVHFERAEFDTDFSNDLLVGYHHTREIPEALELKELAGYIEESLELLRDQQ